jgi:hypothetical protein
MECKEDDPVWESEWNLGGSRKWDKVKVISRCGAQYRVGEVVGIAPPID